MNYQQQIKNIVSQIIEISKGLKHPDEIARIYSVFMDIGLEITMRFATISSRNEKRITYS